MESKHRPQLYQTANKVQCRKIDSNKTHPWPRQLSTIVSWQIVVRCIWWWPNLLGGCYKPPGQRKNCCWPLGSRCVKKYLVFDAVTLMTASWIVNCKHTAVLDILCLPATRLWRLQLAPFTRRSVQTQRRAMRCSSSQTNCCTLYLAVNCNEENGRQHQLHKSCV